MARRYWGTFSIYDHRADFYRPSLLLFDRIIMPVPTRTWKGIADPEELEQLWAEATWLQEHGCAVRFDWDPDKFEAWQANEIAAAAAGTIDVASNSTSASSLRAKIAAAAAVGDAPLNTRYQLQHLIESGALSVPDVETRDDVTAMPVVASREAIAALGVDRLGIDIAQQMTVDLIFESFPVPAPDSPLEDIVRLRERGFIAEQVGKLREWQLELIVKLIEDGQDPGLRKLCVEQARQQLENAIADYRRGMGEVIDRQRRARITTLFSLKNPLEAVKTGYSERGDLFSALGAAEHCWKTLYREPFAFAGLVCSTTGP